MALLMTPGIVGLAFTMKRFINPVTMTVAGFSVFFPQPWCFCFTHKKNTNVHQPWQKKK